MQKSIKPLLVVALIFSILFSPGQTAFAQGISLPADVNKTFSPISILAGGTSLLRVTIFNPNSFQLTNASWFDDLPSQITIASLVSNTCGGTVTANAGSSRISLSGGTVPAQSGSTPGECTVSVNVTSTTPGNWINTIPAGRLTSNGPGGINITNSTAARATLNVTAVGVPSVTKSFNPNNIWAGGTSQLSITITNGANTTLTGVSLPDTLPTGVILASPFSSTLSGCGGAASVTPGSGGRSIILNNGTIASGATCTITVTVTSNVQGGYTNTIPAQTLQNNQNLTNATAATARLNVREIGLTKRFSPPTLSGDGTGTSTLIITLQNPKTTPYTGVSVTDNLPTPLTAMSVSANTCGGSVSITPSTTVSLTGGTIPAGSLTAPGTCTISVQVTVPAGTPSGRLTNTIPTTGLTNNQGIGLLSPVSASVTVSGAEASGIKTFTPSSIPVGSNSRLRIEITAPNSRDLTNFSITDPLPVNVIISNSTAPAMSNCGPGASLTANLGDKSISLTGGLILAGQTCRIDVFVTSNIPSPAGSPYTNTIPPSNITSNGSPVLANGLTSNLTVTGTSALSISLVKGFDPDHVFGGAASTMSIELINLGNVTLTGITFTDNMPMDPANPKPGTGMILANPLNFNVGSCGGTLSGAPGANSFSYSGGSLPPFARCTLTLSATMTVNSNLINTIDAQAVTTDQRVTNADPTSATLTNQPGASVSKSFAPNPIPVGSYSLLTITIQNTGNIGLSGMGVSDSLTAGIEIAGSAAPAPVTDCGGTLTAVSGTQLIELADGVLAGNATCTIVVGITGANAGDYQNTIPAGALRTSPSVSVTNTTPATDTLRIVGSSGGGGNPSGGGGRGKKTKKTAVANSFLIPVTGFAPDVVTKLDTFSRSAYDATGMTLQIPVIKVNSSIVGVESKKGSWDVSWLQDQVGWLNGTAYPTWKGNSVLTAHVVNADGKPGVFSRLKALGLGEYIFIYDSGYRYTYKVVSNDIVQPNDASVMKHEEKSFLTLITCDSYDAKTGTYLHRVVIGAALVDVREIR